MSDLIGSGAMAILRLLRYLVVLELDGVLYEEVKITVVCILAVRLQCPIWGSANIVW